MTPSTISVLEVMPTMSPGPMTGPFVIVGRRTKAATFDSVPRWSVSGSPILILWITWTPLTPASRPAGSGEVSGSAICSGVRSAAAGVTSIPSRFTNVCSPASSRPRIASVAPVAIGARSPSALTTCAMTGWRNGMT